MDRAVREVVVLAAGLPDEAMPGLALEYDYQTGDPALDTTALEVRRLRREADEVTGAATARTSQAAAQLAARGLSGRARARHRGAAGDQRAARLAARRQSQLDAPCLRAEMRPWQAVAVSLKPLF